MPNPYLNILTGFERGFGQGIQDEEITQREKILSQREKQRQFDELQRQKDLLDYKNQIQSNNNVNIQDKLSALLSGKTTDLEPKFAPTIGGNNIIGSSFPQQPTQRDLTPQDRMRMLLGLPKSVQDEYSKYQKNQEDLAQQDLVNNLVNETDPEKIKSGLSQLTPNNLKRYAQIKTATKPTKPESVSLGQHIDSKLNRIIESKGYLNPNADEKSPSTRIINGQKYTVTGESSMGKAFKTGGNGKKDFSNATKSVYKKWESQLEKLNYDLDNNVDAQGNPLDETTRKEAEKAKSDFQAKFAEHIKKEMPDSAKKWYRNLYNDAKKEGLQIDSETFWNKVKKAYVNGEFSKNKDEENLAMRYLRELHYATYNEDPAKKYAGFSDTGDDGGDNSEDNQ